MKEKINCPLCGMCEIEKPDAITFADLVRVLDICSRRATEADDDVLKLERLTLEKMNEMLSI